jgi:hypothetical protein
MSPAHETDQNIDPTSLDRLLPSDQLVEKPISPTHEYDKISGTTQDSHHEKSDENDPELILDIILMRNSHF